jgi:hypothetical protein
MENITTEVVEKEDQPEQKLQTAIKDISIDNENVALNVLVGMINIAQKRGAFNLEESSKAWECIQMFMKSPTSQ